MYKKYIILNIILTFIMGFLVHNIYNWYPSFITSIFPVNESLYEHIKLIFLSPILSVLLLNSFKGFNINNIWFGL